MYATSVARDGEKYAYVKPTPKIHKFVFFPYVLIHMEKAKPGTKSKELIARISFEIDIIILLLIIRESWTHEHDRWRRMMPKASATIAAMACWCSSVHKTFKILHGWLSADLFTKFLFKCTIIPETKHKKTVLADEVVYFQNAPRCIGVGSFPRPATRWPFLKTRSSTNPCDKHELNDFPLNLPRRDSSKTSKNCQIEVYKIIV